MAINSTTGVRIREHFLIFPKTIGNHMKWLVVGKYSQLWRGGEWKDSMWINNR